MPRPVTGSQPVVAGNPFVPHPGLSPVVTSLRADAPVEYKNGLRKPSVGLPAEINRSLSRAITLAKIGLEQLVPSTVPNVPLTTISTSTPENLAYASFQAPFAMLICNLVHVACQSCTRPVTEVYPVRSQNNARHLSRHSLPVSNPR